MHAGFRNLYKQAPTDLKRLIFNQWKAKQSTVHHPEGNTLKHIIIVTARAFNKFPNNKNIQLAAFFHDLGKFATFALHPSTGQPTAHGHEKESAALVDKYKPWIKQQGADPEVVQFIVINHMRAQPQTWQVMKNSKKELLKQHPKFQDLIDFTTIDKGGYNLVQESR